MMRSQKFRKSEISLFTGDGAGVRISVLPESDN